jgi:hypothetical protein
MTGKIFVKFAVIFKMLVKESLSLLLQLLSLWVIKYIKELWTEK